MRSEGPAISLDARLAAIERRQKVTNYLLIVVGVVTICALGLSALGINRSNHLAVVTKRAADAAVAQSRSNSAVLQALRGLSQTAADAALAAKTSSADAKTAADASKAASDFLAGCFVPPNGPCVKSSANALTEIRKAQAELLSRTSFVVTNPAKPGEMPLTVTPVIHESAVPRPAPACLGVGNVEVLGGVAACKP